MKIAVIAHAHFPIRRPYEGGLETHTHQMVNELVRQGHDVTLFAKAGSQTNAKHVTIARGQHYNGRNPIYDYRYRYAMSRVLLGSFDLIINNSLNHIPLEEHTETMPPMVTIFHTPPLPKLVRVLSASTTQANRTYIAVSSFTASQWAPYCPDSIEVVGNGIDLTHWQARTTSNKPHAAWVGRITPEKGLHLALEACIAMGMPITCSGSIYDKTYFNKTIQPLLAHPLVTYKGHADSQEVNTIYKNASVALVTPMWDEPFGLVAIEALASGTPVAALARGGLTSLITPEVGALATDSTATALQFAIKHAATKPREMCAQYAAKNFTLQSMVEQYLALVPVTKEHNVESLSWATSP